MTFDLLISNARIVDGTGNPWFRANLGLDQDKIVAVGELRGSLAKRVIDAEGMIVCPGFIDVHSHSDYSLTVNPTADNQVAQGVTTEVIGNCGVSWFPTNDKSRQFLSALWHEAGDWSTPEEYFALLTQQGVGVNVVPLAGHSTIRAAVLGEDNQPARPTALEEMKALLHEAMEAGCAGYSTGLQYAPGLYAETDEVIELGAVVAEHSGIYATHTRGYSHNVVEATQEAIEVGRRNNIRVQISHVGVYGRKNWGLAQRILSVVQQAREEGVEVTMDQLAYPTLGVWWGLAAVFPKEVYSWRDGGPCNYSQEIGKLVEMLKHPDSRERLREMVEHRRLMDKHGWWEEFDMFSDWRDIYIEEVQRSTNEELVGKNLTEVASLRGGEPCDVYFDLILEEGTGLSTTHRPTSLDDFYTFLRSPLVMVSTDAIASAAGLKDQPFMYMPAHPRQYGTYPYVLEKHVRVDRLMSLPEAVRKMTSLPASAFRLHHRGLIREGMQADLVVLDPDRVAQKASYLHPCRYPAGISYVAVNGELVVDNGELTGALPGKLLTGQHVG